jgi:hypothetical protein
MAVVLLSRSLAFFRARVATSHVRSRAFTRDIDYAVIRDAFSATMGAIGNHAVSSCFNAARF